MEEYEYHGFEYVDSLKEYPGADQMAVGTAILFYSDRAPVVEGGDIEGEHLVSVYRSAHDKWVLSELAPRRRGGASHEEVYSWGVHTSVKETSWARKSLHLLLEEVVIFAPKDAEPDFTIGETMFVFPKITARKADFIKDRLEQAVSGVELTSDAIDSKHSPLNDFASGWGTLFLIAGHKLGLWTAKKITTGIVGVRAK